MTFASIGVRAGMLGVLAAFGTNAVGAQQPTFTPDHADGIYRLGERIGWTATFPAGARAAAGYRYTIRRFGTDSIGSGALSFVKGRARIETSLAEPATLVVEVTPPVGVTDFGNPSTGGKGRVRLGAAIEPTRIAASEPKPADFDAFWAEKLRKLAAVPVNPVVTPGESDRIAIEWFTLRLDNVDSSHVYGQLARPAGEGKYPAVLQLQWASAPYPLQKSWVTSLAALGYLALNIEPHDVPGDMPQAFYDALPAVLKHYESIGALSRDESYFLRMYLGAYRAVEYLASRPDWDGKTIVVIGTSMGGQQSFVTAGLNPRVTDLIVNVPAGADVTAALHKRAESYPKWKVSNPRILETARYFDTANFASRITARSLVGVAFIDDLSPPAGVWAVFNQITGRKEIVPMPDSPHNHVATAAQQRPIVKRTAEWLEAIAHGRDPLTPAPVKP